MWSGWVEIGKPIKMEMRAEMKWIKQLVCGLWVWECQGMCVMELFYHGIIMEILLNTTYKYVFFGCDLSQKKVCYSSFLWAVTGGPFTLTISCVLWRCGENILSITCCQWKFSRYLCPMSCGYVVRNKVWITSYHLDITWYNLSVCVASSSVCNSETLAITWYLHLVSTYM